MDTKSNLIQISIIYLYYVFFIGLQHDETPKNSWSGSSTNGADPWEVSVNTYRLFYTMITTKTLEIYKKIFNTQNNLRGIICETLVLRIIIVNSS